MRDDGDGRVDVFEGRCGVENIVTIDTAVTGSCSQIAGQSPTAVAKRLSTP